MLLAATAISGRADSVLTTPLETPSQQAAREVVQNVQGAKTSIIGILRHGVGQIADAQDKQAVLDALGTKGGEVVALYNSLTAWLTATLTVAGDTAGLAEVQAISSRMPALTVHEDGTATLTPES